MTTKAIDLDFYKAVKNGGRSVNTRNFIPVLKCVLIRQNGGRLEVISNNLETFSRDFVGGEEVRHPKNVSWEYAVPAKPLTDWLRVLEPKKKNPVVLEMEVITPTNPYPVAGPNLHWDKRSYFQVKAGNITAKFFGIDAEEFPDMSRLSRFEGPVDRHPIVENGA